MLLLLLTIGCGSDPEPPAPTDGPPTTSDTAPIDDSTDTGAAGTTATTGATAPTGDTAPPLPEYDCSTVPVTPVSTQILDGPTGYHDLAFTDDGRAIGASRQNNHLQVSDYAGSVSVLTPQIGLTEQMVWLPDGDLAVASYTEGIVRVAPSGGRVPIQASIFAYGLILGPDEMLYAADQSRVYRVDPATGATDVLLEPGALTRGSPRVIAFDLSYERMFIGTYGGSQGRIYVVDLDATYTPVGEPTVFVSGVGRGGYHDAITLDVCGYLYIPDYDTKTLWRVTPRGTIVQEYEKSPGLVNSDYPHGVTFGNGVGGWRDDAIYLPMPYNQNKVRELVVGVPPRDADVVAVNLPTW